MSRVLTIQRTTIPPVERARYLARLEAKRAHFDASRCRFWVFEDTTMRNAFVEFTEADDADTLAAAHATAPESVVDSVRIYQQLEY